MRTRFVNPSISASCSFSRKLSAFLLAFLMVIPLAACGKTDPPAPAQTTASAGETSATETTTEAATTQPTCDLPDTDWKGRAFRVLGDSGSAGARPQFANFEILTEELNGEVFNDALFNRNGDVGKKYNVTFEQYLDPTVNHTGTLLQQFIAAGEDKYDLVFMFLSKIGGSAQSGHLFNMNNVKYIDDFKPWWNEDVNESPSVGGKVYFTTSDYSLRDKNRAYVLIYNPKLAADNKIPDLVPLVREGKWVVDKMTEYNEIVSKDIDGDGVMTDQDVWGITMDSYNSLNAFWVSCDCRCISKDSKGDYSITINNQHTIDALDKLIKALCNTKTGGFCNDFQGKVTYDYWSFSALSFVGGKSLFNTAFPHSLEQRSEMCDFDYTVIPFPKYDEAQEKYLTMPDPNSMLFGIPATLKETDFAGFMLEALSYASTDTTLKAYIEITCKSKYSANPVSTEMLDVTFDGIRYDIDKIYGIGLYDLVNAVAAAKENNFASAYAAAKDSVQTKLDDLVKAIGKLDH